MDLGKTYMPPTSYVLDVCATCGKQAKWPFCEHKPTGFAVDREPWTIIVRATLSHGEIRRLGEAMALMSEAV